MLQNTKQALVAELAKNKRRIPRIIFSAKNNVEQNHKSSRPKEIKKLKEAAKRRLLNEVAEENESDDDDEPIPRKLLKETEQKVHRLEKKCRDLQKELCEERQHNRRFQDALLRQFEVLDRNGLRQTEKMSSELVEDMSSSGIVLVDPTQDTSLGPIGDEHPVAIGDCPRNSGPGGSQHGLVQELIPVPCTVTAAASMPSCHSVTVPEPMLVPATQEESLSCAGAAHMPVCGEMADAPEIEVHLGSKVFIDQDKLNLAMDAKSDSLFCREASRALWEPAELVGRSVTGEASRRFKKEDRPARRRLTPTKLDALKVAFSRYIQTTTESLDTGKREEARAARLALFRSHMATMLNDINKKRKQNG